MLGISEERVKTLLSDCKKYDILRPTDCRGKFAVNAYLFSTGSAIETRNLQAHFDFDNNVYHSLRVEFYSNIFPRLALNFIYCGLI